MRGKWPTWLDPDRLPWVLYLLFGLGFAARAVYHLVNGWFAAALLVGLISALQFRAAFRRRRGQSVVLWSGSN